MTAATLAMEAFNSKYTRLLTGTTQKQLVYWDKQGIVKPSISPASGRGSRRLYSYLDLLALMTVKNLKEAGFSLQKIRTCVSYLRGRGLDVTRPLAFCKLLACGNTIYFLKDEATYIDTLKRPGQTAVRDIIDVGMLDRALRVRVLSLLRKRVREVSVGQYSYQVEIEPDEEEGGYVATIAGLSGCITDGVTLEEVLENTKDAIQAWLEARDELQREGAQIPISRVRHRRRASA